MYINKPNSTYETLSDTGDLHPNIFYNTKDAIGVLMNIQNIYRHIFLL